MPSTKKWAGIRPITGVQLMSIMLWMTYLQSQKEVNKGQKWSGEF